jgi:hypothetical protein
MRLGHLSDRAERGPAAGGADAHPERLAVQTDRDGLIGVDLIAKDREGLGEAPAVRRHSANDRGGGGERRAKTMNEGAAVHTQAGDEGQDGRGGAG